MNLQLLMCYQTFFYMHIHQNAYTLYEMDHVKYHFGGKMFVFGFTNPLARNTVYNQFRKHLRIGINGFGYTHKNSLSGKLEVGEVVMLHGKVYYNLDKLGGYKEFNIHVEIINIIENIDGLNYVVMINMLYLRLYDLRHSCVSLMMNNKKCNNHLLRWIIMLIVVWKQ